MGAADGLRAMLDVRPTGGGRFEAGSAGEGAGAVVFGGQIMAQSLLVAAVTISDKQVLSLQTVFSRGASTAELVEIVVTEMHRGRAFASVSVTVSQNGRLCAGSFVLLHEPSPDLIRHADDPPRTPGPDDVPPSAGGPEWWERRVVDGVDLGDPDAVGPPELRLWSRFPGSPGDLASSQALLAYASDGFLIGTAMRPHPGVGQSMAHTQISTTVLAHTIAFHEPFRASDWLLLYQRSTYAGRGRAHGHADAFTVDGRLVASFSQSSMIRDFPAGQAPAAGERADH